MSSRNTIALGLSMLLALAAGCTGLPTAPATDDHVARDDAMVEAADEPFVRAAEPEPVSLLPGIEPAGESASGETPSSRDLICGGPGFGLLPDGACFLSGLAHDATGLCTWRNGVILLAGSGVSFGIHEGLDDQVARYTAGHERRWGDIDGFFKVAGNPLTHLSVATGLYAYSFAAENDELNDLSKTLFNAVAIDTAATSILKFAANTRRPDGDRWGWPSGHVSSSFAVAAVLDEYYGHEVGIPAFFLAGLVAWERIDDRKHDLSDVVFGALLGYVIGQTIGADHHARFCGFDGVPYVDPATGASGVAFQKEF